MSSSAPVERSTPPGRAFLEGRLGSEERAAPAAAEVQVEGIMGERPDWGVQDLEEEQAATEALAGA
jgi:hypothetical protein